MAEREALLVELGTIAYADALELQRHLVALRREGAVPDLLLLCEHPPVITIGRSGGQEHILGQARARRVPIHEVERGGDVTYHGPGQLVGYPILALEGEERDLHLLLRRLEEAVIRTVGTFGMAGTRVRGLTGVWAGGSKVCAIGVAVRHWVTLHGFALNVNTDLEPFRWIVPCGLHGHGVTSMARELGAPLDFAAVKAEAARQFGEVFGRELRAASGRVGERGGMGDAEAGQPPAPPHSHTPTLRSLREEP